MNTLTALVAAHLEQFARTPARGRIPRENTLRAHRLHLERFARRCDLGHTDSDKLTVNVCKNWLLDVIATTGRSNINQALTALDHFLQWLVDEGDWPRDKYETWTTFKKSQYQPWRRRGLHHKFLRPDQLSALFTAMADGCPNPLQTDRDIAFFGTILICPSRLGELQRLDCTHIQYLPESDDLPARYRIHVPASIAKDAEDHVLWVLQGAIAGGVDIYGHFDRYAVWRRLQSDSGPFFVVIRADRFLQRPSTRNFAKVLATAAKRAGVTMTSHWLRHTCGEIAPSVLDERDLRQLFGHSDARTTAGYTDHDNDDRLLDAVRRVQAVIAQY